MTMKAKLLVVFGLGCCLAGVLSTSAHGLISGLNVLVWGTVELKRPTWVDFQVASILRKKLCNINVVLA
jgi:hypothetical protein